jgi:hypothetical protein
MRADFGFDPGTVGLSNLALMTNRTGVYVAAQTPPVYAYNAVAGFSWGWNGPYWTGPVQPSAGLPGGLPVDGWGKPIQLRVTNVAGSIYYQLVSGGANGQIGGAFAADDIVYPTNPMPRTALYSTLSVNIYNRSSATVTGISFMSQQKAQSNNLPGPSSVSLNGSWVVGASVNQSLTNQLPGPMTLTIQRTLPNTPPISSTVYVGDLLPGEYRIIDTAIN